MTASRIVRDDARCGWQYVDADGELIAGASEEHKQQLIDMKRKDDAGRAELDAGRPSQFDSEVQ